MDIDGRQVAKKIQSELTELIKGSGRAPGIAFILVGEDAPSLTYVHMKKKACESVGIHSREIKLPESASEKDLIEVIQSLNKDKAIHGILVQMPLPKQIDTTKIIEAIDPKKDVDGLHPENIGRWIVGNEKGFIPCTPFGVLKLLEAYKIDPSGKRVLVIGRSALVGRPLANLLSQNRPFGNATVTLAHSQSENLPALCKEADILIAAIGKPHFIKKEMVKKGCIVIDVGINRIAGKIVGDVDYEKVKEVASLITPVPGGVGPMTIAMLLYNTTKSCLQEYFLKLHI